jgi:hypothetical protein
MYVCVFVCVYVCMYVYIYIYIFFICNIVRWEIEPCTSQIRILVIKCFIIYILHSPFCQIVEILLWYVFFTFIWCGKILQENKNENETSDLEISSFWFVSCSRWILLYLFFLLWVGRADFLLRFAKDFCQQLSLFSSIPVHLECRSDRMIGHTDYFN